MQPPRTRDLDQGDLFRSRLDQMLDPSHSLFKLAQSIDWNVFEREFEPLYDAGNGRPGLPIRLMVGLHYLKHLYDVSDEVVVATWLENPYWQYFCGGTYFEHDFPCDPTSLVRWRQRVGAAGMQKLLEQTLSTAKRSGLIKAGEVREVNVDTTVQQKAVAFPTDARLYDKCRRALVRVAKANGLSLRQSYTFLGKKALHMQGRYSAARQGKRARRETKKLRTYLGRVLRDVKRQVAHHDTPDPRLGHIIEIAERIYTQKRADGGKIYSVHAPEVVCIAKGKVHQKYEFGCKAHVVTTSRHNWILSLDAEHGDGGAPYDGSTLKNALRQARELVGLPIEKACVDRGFRGSSHHPEDVEILVSGRRGLKVGLKKLLRRRSAIEPVISHAKREHRLDRNYLKGKEGDRINAILSGCGFNLRKLLRSSHRLKAVVTFLLHWITQETHKIRVKLLLSRGYAPQRGCKDIRLSLASIA